MPQSVNPTHLQRAALRGLTRLYSSVLNKGISSGPLLVMARIAPVAPEQVGGFVSKPEASALTVLLVVSWCEYVSVRAICEGLDPVGVTQPSYPQVIPASSGPTSPQCCPRPSRPAAR